MDCLIGQIILLLKVKVHYSLILVFSFLACINSSLVNADIKNGEMEIVQINDNVYQHISYNLWKNKFTPSNGLIVLDQKNAYIIDTPWRKEDTKNLVAWIKQQNLNLRASISTHFHDDRASGIEYLNKIGVKTVASHRTNQLLKRENKTPATIGFESDNYWFLKDKIHAYYPGAGHSMDNIVVWLAEHKILVGGCLIRSAESRGMGYTADGSVKDWSKSVSKVKKKFSDIKIVFPGHGKLGDQSLLSHTIELANKASQKQ